MAAQQTDAGARLADVVQQYARVVASALSGGGGHFDLSGSAMTAPRDPVAVAAVRVLGADVLAPCLLAGRSPCPADLALVGESARAFPPGPSATPVVAWSHWALRRALDRAAAGGPPAPAVAGIGEPEAGWVSALPWQELSRRAAQLAALADPGAPCGLSMAFAARPVDLARGFVRAVRRQDWLQAAGTGRWLAGMSGVPDSLGLDAGLAWVAHRSEGDARVTLHLGAARLAGRAGRAGQT